MPSRLKGIETRHNARETPRIYTLDMPSRLKGIETCRVWRRYAFAGDFGYAFPFEGN